jgi:hypothetical protein
MTATRCRGRARHWRIAFGTVGLRTPVCVYCGDPNPKPLTDQEWAELIYYSTTVRNAGGQYVRAAIEAREAEKAGRPQ